MRARLLINKSKGHSYSGKQFGSFLPVKHTLPRILRDHGLVLHLLIPGEVKAHMHTKICVLMFVAAVFVIAQTLRQPAVRHVVHG